MSQDKSIFDKLYEQVMGEDDEFELGLPGDDDLGGDGLGDELGDFPVLHQDAGTARCHSRLEPDEPAGGCCRY